MGANKLNLASGPDYQAGTLYSRNADLQVWFPYPRPRFPNAGSGLSKRKEEGQMKEIVGIREYAFEDRRTGELIEGYTVHLQFQQDDTQGVCCEQYSISRAKLDVYVPQIGDVVKIGLNKYGKADFMIKVA